MKVILLEDVKKQGKKDDVIEVSDGYAQNYLIRNKLAIKYTPGSKDYLDKNLEKLKKEEAALIEECKKIKSEIEQKDLTFGVKVGKEGKLFGSITSKQISEKLDEMNIKVDKKQVKMTSPIDTLGSHKIKINLHKKVTAEAKIFVEAN